MKNCVTFLSLKGLTHMYFAKITHKKYLTPQFLENNDPILPKSGA